MKKAYVKPQCNVKPLQFESSILAGSGTDVKSQEWKNSSFDIDLSSEGTEVPTSTSKNIWSEN